MKNFAIGLGLGLLGLITWIIVSVLIAAGEATHAHVSMFFYVMMGLGFAVMLLAPLVFWLIIPLRAWAHRRKVSAKPPA